MSSICIACSIFLLLSFRLMMYFFLIPFSTFPHLHLLVCRLYTVFLFFKWLLQKFKCSSLTYQSLKLFRMFTFILDHTRTLKPLNCIFFPQLMYHYFYLFHVYLEPTNHNYYYYFINNKELGDGKLSNFVSFTDSKVFYFALFFDSLMKMYFTFIHDTVMQDIVSILKLSMKCDLCACINDQLCSILCDPIDCSPPGSSIHGILQAGILEWVPSSYSKRCSQPRDWTHVSCISCISRQILYHCTTWETKMWFTWPKKVYTGLREPGVLGK